MINYNGKILVLGAGSVSQCVLPLLFNVINVPPSNITVLDAQDRKTTIGKSLEKGINFIVKKITRENYKQVLSEYLSEGDFLLDLTVEIDTCALLEWCYENKVFFLNTATEVWSTSRVPVFAEPREQTLYQRYQRLWKLVSKWNLSSTTAIVEHGANPGLISHFVKKGLMDISQKLILTETGAKKGALQEAVRVKDFARMAYLSGLRVIHISEKDTQISAKPKQDNEFVNTWSCDGFVEEAIAPAEIGWGTHEKQLPKNGYSHASGLQHQVYTSTQGFKKHVRSWVPSGEIQGAVIRHGEASSLTASLTVYDGIDPLYRPTVHYAYSPTPDAMASLKELEQRRWKMQENQRIFNDDIVSGVDELGCLLMGDHFDPIWIGSILDIEEARKLVPHQNATTIQVAIAVIAGMAYAIQHPNSGFCLAENLNTDEILKMTTPYLGKFVSVPVTWDLLKDKNYQFSNFEIT